MHFLASRQKTQSSQWHWAQFLASVSVAFFYQQLQLPSRWRKSYTRLLCGGRSNTSFPSPDDLIATVVALALSIRVIGGSIGFTIYYNVFTTKLAPLLPAYVAKYAIAAGLPASSAVEFTTTYLTAPANLTGSVSPTILAGAALGSSWAYSEALKWVWYISIPFGICATIASGFIGNTESYMTNRIAAHIVHK